MSGAGSAPANSRRPPLEPSAGTKKIGLIGLGLMGRPMGMNLIKAGHSLTVWNRTASRTDELVAAGAKLAKSPQEVAAASDFLLTIVSDPPALARKIAAACAERGVHFLDAPVTGGDWGAKKGELLFMIGGDAGALKDVEPILGVMGKKWFHLGPNGAGQTVKLAMNLILALQVDALAEALALVTRADIPGEKLVEVMQSSMARSGVLDVKAPNLLKGEYVPSFPLRLMHKDLGLALDLANQLGVALPATAAARETYNYVKGAAKEDLDYSAVMRFWKR